MRLETLLPLGKVDPGLRAPETGLDLAAVAADAALLEEIGYDGVAVEETKQDPYIVMALAAAATRRLRVSTAIAMAFPRSPTVTALSAWTLQKLAKGRFTLGLGPQVRAHIERRYGLAWSAPGPWMREYVAAVRAVWRCWQDNQPLDVKGPHYKLNLMPPLFNPGPIEHPAIPIHLAAVNVGMCQVAGEVADGVRPHPICSAQYIAEVMIPELRKGAARAGRSLAEFKICHKPLVATARNTDELELRVRDVRARLAFYISTPSYRPAVEHHGLGDLARKLSLFARAQDWEKMPPCVSDEVLQLFAVVGTHEEIAAKLLERFGHVVTHCEFSIAVRNEADKEQLTRIAATLKAAPDTAVRRRLMSPG
ncbi:MAG TPA: TIGR03617 family F420-dependent LLM class oxidoreductase [Hyphomicrobiaceae bacterium]|jgi:probable F420-dependent oxidoreductase|nr:TIGR03617 family F420-dependent LLM class oxidoreductase [Hyphomicrobiaceae bacterium]